MASPLGVSRTTCRALLVSTLAPSMLSNSVVALRVSRCLPGPLSRAPSRRCQATVSAMKDGSALGIDASQNVASKSSAEQHATPAEPQTWTSLEGRVNHDILKALTTEPFNLTTMTPVQFHVTSLFPDLVRPWDPEGIVRPLLSESRLSNSTSPGEHSKPPRDLLVRARTGTGKSFAFLIPAIQSRLNHIEHHARLAVIKTGLTPSPEFTERVRTAYRRLCPGSLILCPTRELAIQIANEALKLSAHLKDFEVRLFVGGAQKGSQIGEWMRHKRDLVVATPGRLRDLLENEPEVRKGFKDCPMLILDEADTLLDMGFRDDIDAIRSYLPRPPARQTFLFSATMPRGVRQIAFSLLSQQHAFIDTAPPSPLSSIPSLKIPQVNSPAITLTNQGVKGLKLPLDDELSTHAHVPQFHTLLPHADAQFPTLMKLIAHDQLVHGKKSKIIVFFPTTHMTALGATLLRNLIRSPSGSSLKGKEKNTTVVNLDDRPFFVPFSKTRIFELHSKRTPNQRSMASMGFRTAGVGADERKKLPSVLVTSDVSARGVDYPGVTRVIQVGIPSNERVYVHRVGRTARGKDAMPPSNSDSPPSQSESDHQGKDDAANLDGIGPARADMLLLPFEAGFVTWQLLDLPIKALPVETLDRQIKTLVERSQTAPLYHDRHFEKMPHPPIHANVDISKDALQNALFALLPRLNSNAIQRTAASLMGYYLPLVTSLRSQPGTVLTGIVSWASTLGVEIPHTADPEKLLRYLGVSLPYVKNLHMDGKRITVAAEEPRRKRDIGRKIETPKWMTRGKVTKKTKKQKV